MTDSVCWEKHTLSKTLSWLLLIMHWNEEWTVPLVWPYVGLEEYETTEYSWESQLLIAQWHHPPCQDRSCGAFGTGRTIRSRWAREFLKLFFLRFLPILLMFQFSSLKRDSVEISQFCVHFRVFSVSSAIPHSNWLASHHDSIRLLLCKFEINARQYWSSEPFVKLTMLSRLKICERGKWKCMARAQSIAFCLPPSFLLLLSCIFPHVTTILAPFPCNFYISF